MWCETIQYSLNFPKNLFSLFHGFLIKEMIVHPLIQFSELFFLNEAQIFFHYI